jgi:NAD-dependent deacetylase
MRIVILTGAGISAESGLDTFRDAGGLWARHDLADLATPEGFARDPALVLDFYNQRRRAARAAYPNPAHEALARLQKDKGDRITLVTQNIDHLHDRAGSDPVIHMHGSLFGALCAACGHRWPAPRVMRCADSCPACGAGSPRPDVVWFGEMPRQMDRITTALAECDLFVAVGTSGAVYPAAGFVDLARDSGAETLELNLEPGDRAGAFDTGRAGPASDLVPAWVDEVLGR